ncbi:pyridoxamine 5'-phosphate oxidase family protein [Maritimibacter sp. UBA3975]|uniref:HugZ family pyridoxamine 5'-phosphate oxidase n=1 Tax=Maritimibacter sp. UBA3975 TaxID=1946833 RepID=UPI000C0B1657|nr:pyridoxamine 5'-phosphate oxidase family protein [Maritimibacter sp. UBA3975]MAM60688.1 pyridoxamine 5-phosphate oxidase [Maritimibacter sp.]|tara:strand:+ start:1937 stop:2437 length:501 start_codon:yes stop_codon:yes gene_type:complete
MAVPDTGPERPRTNPIRPTDDEARRLARSLIDEARFAALAVLAEGRPVVTRIALGTTPRGAPLTLVSDLAAHTVALRADPKASLLVGEPGPRGDPLTHPRLTLEATARFLRKDPALRAHYLATHPKSKLYVDFADFHFVTFDVVAAHLNGGFGKAFRLTPADLGLG